MRFAVVAATVAMVFLVYSTASASILRLVPRYEIAKTDPAGNPLSDATFEIYWSCGGQKFIPAAFDSIVELGAANPLHAGSHDPDIGITKSHAGAGDVWIDLSDPAAPRMLATTSSSGVVDFALHALPSDMGASTSPNQLLNVERVDFEYNTTFERWTHALSGGAGYGTYAECVHSNPGIMTHLEIVEIEAPPGYQIDPTPRQVPDRLGCIYFPAIVYEGMFAMLLGPSFQYVDSAGTVYSLPLPRDTAFLYQDPMTAMMSPAGARPWESASIPATLPLTGGRVDPGSLPSGCRFVGSDEVGPHPSITIIEIDPGDQDAVQANAASWAVLTASLTERGLSLHSVSIVNSPLQAANGTFTIDKRVTGPGADRFGAGDRFEFSVVCTDGTDVVAEFEVVATVDSDGQVAPVEILDVPIGSECSVVEESAGRADGLADPAQVTVDTDTQTVEIVNVYSAGVLSIKPTVIGTPPPDTVLTVNVVCVNGDDIIVDEVVEIVDGRIVVISTDDGPVVLPIGTRCWTVIAADGDDALWTSNADGVDNAFEVLVDGSTLQELEIEISVMFDAEDLDTTTTTEVPDVAESTTSTTVVAFPLTPPSTPKTGSLPNTGLPDALGAMATLAVMMVLLGAAAVATARWHTRRNGIPTS